MPTSDNQEGNEEGKTSKVKLPSDQRILLMVSERGAQGAAVGTGSDEGVAGPAVTTVGGGLLLSPWGPHRSGPEGTGSSQVPALWSPPKSSKSRHSCLPEVTN
ncbi:unnamed protein product [Rangifer tarandus platyrhynchus]|uniref:Uncharacterized protein n=2 Tax=Rangifer tarandus platyrhynchus TaxID=3082113 RepID=A0ABN8YZ30_RANTA|nr:unnamed protein product [Rangifer tarandus platyrhynchus]CAI9702537.1 unnamed protein product [Rangifer tarandus platyrhynchus]